MGSELQRELPGQVQYHLALSTTTSGHRLSQPNPRHIILLVPPALPGIIERRCITHARH